MCHISHPAPEVVQYTHTCMNTQTLLNYPWWHRLTCTQADTHSCWHTCSSSHSVFSISPDYPRSSNTHTDRHTPLTPQPKSSHPPTTNTHTHISNHRCFHDDFNHFLLWPLDAAVREEISCLKSSSILCLHHRFQPALFISGSLPSLFISEEIIRGWFKKKERRRRKTKLNCKPHKKRMREREREKKVTITFVKHLVFGIFLGPLSLAVLSPLRRPGF